MIKASWCVIPTISHSGNAKLWRQWKDQWLQEVSRKGRMDRPVKLLCMILSWWIHVIIHLSKPMKHEAVRVKPKLWSLSDVNSWWACIDLWCTALERMLIMGRLCVCGGRRHMGTLCTFGSILWWIYSCSKSLFKALEGIGGHGACVPIVDVS